MSRNPVKKLFITFPQSGTVSAADFLKTLQHFPLSFYRVCTETHKDGQPHLHAAIEFKGKYSKAFVLKYMKTVYPEDWKRIHMEPVRSMPHALHYFEKEGLALLGMGPYVNVAKARKMYLRALNNFFNYPRDYKAMMVEFNVLPYYHTYDQLDDMNKFKELWDLLPLARKCQRPPRYVSLSQDNLLYVPVPECLSGCLCSRCNP